MLHRREGGYERHLQVFIFQRANCFSIIKNLFIKPTQEPSLLTDLLCKICQFPIKLKVEKKGT